jgi:hypothetical protein
VGSTYLEKKRPWGELSPRQGLEESQVRRNSAAQRNQAGDPLRPPQDSPTLGASTRMIEPQQSDKIDVAAGGKLVVPREDIAAGIDDGSELDLAANQNKKIRKPGRREWIALNAKSELTTRLLQHKPKADGIEVDYYFVEPKLRGPIRDELKDVRVFIYWSFATNMHALWIVNVTLGNSWYESLQSALSQPAEFFQQNAIRVIADRDNSKYRVKYKPLPSSVTWPEETTDQLLGIALGSEKFITTCDHSIYRELIEGVELT